MQIICAQENIPESFSKSLFLAGPSPRNNTPEEYNWRKLALSILEKIGYDGVVFVPLPRNYRQNNLIFNYDNQVKWEQDAMDRSDIIVFWVPRDMKYLPGLTTNFEFGQRIALGNVVLGYPKDAEKMSYLQWMAKNYNLSATSNSLEETLKIALNKIGPGSPRDGGECMVPIHIWNTEYFQNWYIAQIKAGNRLDGAKIIFHFLAGPNKNIPVFSGILVNIWIKSEQRNKSNEIIFLRQDIMTIVAVRGSELLIIKEFRSPVSNNECMVYENAGGSSWKADSDYLAIASHEFEEETGLKIDKDRFFKLEKRQLAATALTHKAHLFAVELTEEELNWCKQKEKENVSFGVKEDTEKTYLKVMNIQDIFNNELLDWANLGMIFSALNQ